MVLLTLNLLLGLLVSTNYNPAREWPRRKLPVPLFRIHNWTAYVALTVVLLHPTILLFSSTAHFAHRRCPAAAPLAGSAAVQLPRRGNVLRVDAGRRHVVFPAEAGISSMEEAALYCLSRGGIDVCPRNADRSEFEERARRISWMARKVLVEGCGLLVLAGAIWRVRRGTEKQRHRAAARYSAGRV